MNEREQNLLNRIHLIRQLRDEVMGPWSDFENHGVELPRRPDGSGWMLPKDLMSQRQLLYIRGESGDCQEVLNSLEPPSQRYGVGVLYPTDAPMSESAADVQTAGEVLTEEEVYSSLKDAERHRKNIEPRLDRLERMRDDEVAEPDTGAADMLSDTNTFRPSAMGISFKARVGKNTIFKIKVHGGRYQSIQILPFMEKPAGSSADPEEAAVQTDGPSDDLSASVGDSADTPTPRAVNSTEEPAGSESPAIAGTDGDPVEAPDAKKPYEVKYWVHVPVCLEFHVPCDRFDSGTAIKGSDFRVGGQPDLGGLKLDLQIYPRNLSPIGSQGERVFTVCLINRTPGGVDSVEQSALFHAWFEVDLENGVIVPYPESTRSLLNEEEESIALIYRSRPVFATGHGCSADWGELIEGNPFIRRCAADVHEIKQVVATPFPCFELPNISPDIVLADGTRLSASMKKLAGLVPDDDGIGELRQIIDGYGEWIGARRHEISTLSERHTPAAERHLKICDESHWRMLRGLKLLETDARAATAFRLANEAIYIQQLRAGQTRKWQFDPVQQRLGLDRPPEAFLRPETEIGRWRPFQIAFILMNLASAVDGGDTDRETVDLIWFPTGGGKTEAYLGLAAYALLYRRLLDPNDSGTHVLMRYTLRLLTAQQFQRASGLACALEHIRRRENRALGRSELGDDAFSIGLWVGGANTPNKNADAISRLNEISRSDGRYAFVLQRCPWCGAEIGRIRTTTGQRKSGKFQKKKTADSEFLAQGLKRRGDEVIFACADHTCEFREQIPVFVVDEQIYAKPPSILIGTIDKFAAVAWEPRVRAIFGIDQDGERRKSPPGLIIQDELHLITGPLGTVSAMYETVINELCTDRRNGRGVLPKIISSTATTCNYTEQIRALYARNKAVLFPPPGLDSADNYFSTHEMERDSSGALVPTPGRIHVGLLASGFPSMQTSAVRLLSSLLNGSSYLDANCRDPWWTVLSFFNSIRELGSGLTLLLGDIPERMAVLRKRLNRYRRENGKIYYENARYINESGILELTSRIDNAEVPAAIENLQRAYSVEKNRAYDCCLASSIIEVGVDITRLALMTITGQPKTTAQYIQVAGRVGRHRNRPGLVVTLYNPARPRDRSHFERFRSYHDRLYSMVEPASLTPFTSPALQKTLSGLIAGYLRQSKENVLSKTGDNPQAARDFSHEVRQLIQTRCEEVTGVPASDDQMRWIDKFLSELGSAYWDKWSISDQMGENPAMLRRAGAACHPNWDREDCWPTLTSMRTVDSECRAGILHPPSLATLSN